MELDPVETVKIGHITEHVLKAYHSDDGVLLLEDLLGFDDQEGHLLGRDHDLHHGDVRVLLDQGGLQSPGNDDGSSVGDRLAGFHHNIFCADHLHDGGLIVHMRLVPLLEDVVCLIEHLLPGYQEGDLSHWTVPFCAGAA